MLWCSAYQTRRYPDRSAAWASSTLAWKLSLTVWPGAMGARSRIERGTVTLSATVRTLLLFPAIRVACRVAPLVAQGDQLGPGWSYSSPR
ncbi:hypothetical protein ACFPRL_20695 [Pseudoclavibacter helvolus]